MRQFLIYGLVTLAKSINHMFADNLWTIGRQYIRTGAFDRFLVRPIDPLFHLLADRFCHDGIGNFLVGLTLVVQLGAHPGHRRDASQYSLYHNGGAERRADLHCLEHDHRHHRFLDHGLRAGDAPGVRQPPVCPVPAHHLPPGDQHPAHLVDPLWLRLVLPGKLPAGA